MSQYEHPKLKSYWITFPEDERFPAGMGVTALSEEEALFLLTSHGYDFPKKAKRTEVKEIQSIQDVPSWVAPNAGPLYFRGIWFPCQNLGHSPSGNEGVIILK